MPKLVEVGDKTRVNLQPPGVSAMAWSALISLSDRLFSQRVAPPVVIVAGGKSAGKTSLIQRLASLDSQWRDSSQASANDALFTLDVPDGQHVRMLEVPMASECSFGSSPHPFDRLMRSGDLRWSKVAVVVWVVDASTLDAAGADADSRLGFAQLHTILASVEPLTPLMIVVNRGGRPADRTGKQLTHCAVDALAPILQKHCESHDGGHGAASRRAWSVHDVPEVPAWWSSGEWMAPPDNKDAATGVSRDSVSRGSLVLFLEWLRRALNKDVQIERFTQRLRLPS